MSRNLGVMLAFSECLCFWALAGAFGYQSAHGHWPVASALCCEWLACTGALALWLALRWHD